MLRIQANPRNGFLLGVADFLGDLWLHYLSIWSWVGIFHQRMGKSSSGKMLIRQNNLLHDVFYCFNLLISVWFALRVLPGRDLKQDRLVTLAFSYSVWQAMDLFIGFFHGTLFGIKNNPETRESLTLHRAQRRLLLTIISFFELVFCYSIIYWVMSRRFGCLFSGLEKGDNSYWALQMSFSTLTTIGYGTYAPDQTITIIVALFQALSGLLVIGGSIAQMASMLKTPYQAPPDNGADGSHGELEESVEITINKYRLRCVLPPLGTLLVISFIYYMSRV